MQLAFGRIAIIALLPILASAASVNYMDSTKAANLVHIQQLLLDDRFAAADTIITAYITAQPTDPAGYLFRASLLLAQMSDQEENLYSAEFKAALDTVELLASRLDTSNARNRGWKHLWLGHAKAYGSVYASRFGSFTSAIGMGFDAKDEYQKGLKQDSTLVDLYFGLGSYHYWKSAKAGILRWLGIFHNDKELGIDELWRASRLSEISRDAAASALIWVYFDNDRYDSAVQMAGQVMKRYPHGKSFLWPLAQGHFEKKKYTEAITTFEELRERLLHDPGNYYNVIECDYEIVQAYDRLGDKSAAVALAQRVAGYYEEISKTVRRRQQGKLGYLKRMADMR